MFSSFKLDIQFTVASSTGDSSTSAMLAEVSHWWGLDQRTQRWHKHLEVLWDLRGLWVQAGRHGPFHLASLAGR